MDRLTLESLLDRLLNLAGGLASNVDAARIGNRHAAVPAHDLFGNLRAVRSDTEFVRDKGRREQSPRRRLPDCHADSVADTDDRLGGHAAVAESGREAVVAPALQGIDHCRVDIDDLITLRLIRDGLLRNVLGAWTGVGKPSAAS